MNKNRVQDLELLRNRAEAAVLLGINQSPSLTAVKLDKR
jgi:hypothetical protein